MTLDHSEYTHTLMDLDFVGEPVVNQPDPVACLIRERFHAQPNSLSDEQKTLGILGIPSNKLSAFMKMRKYNVQASPQKKPLNGKKLQQQRRTKVSKETAQFHCLGYSGLLWSNIPA